MEVTKDKATPSQEEEAAKTYFSQGLKQKKWGGDKSRGGILKDSSCPTGSPFPSPAKPQ